jgi:nickel-dependent lactate racemase
LPDHLRVQVVMPEETRALQDPIGAVDAALATSVGEVELADFENASCAAIAINDKTRPVPHQYLLPPLLRRLEDMGLRPEAIKLLIATGTHAPMRPEEFPDIVPAQVLARYPVLCHDSDDQGNLRHLGTTSRGTPVWINRHFVEADLRIVVGNIEPHQFEGFSGGVKGAAVGLAGRGTINHNHAMMTHPRARTCRYEDNPARQDVEEIGRIVDVHFALNAILNPRKQIARVIAGEPRAVMETGIPFAREVCHTRIAAPFDVVVASPGGYPRDISLYQSQKALAHASLATRDGGTVILAAACADGVGSHAYKRWMAAAQSHEEVLARFEREPFQVGPHKAFLVARDAIRVRVFLVSQMPPQIVRHLLLTPADTVEDALVSALPDLEPGVRLALMPQAFATIPRCTG